MSSDARTQLVTHAGGPDPSRQVSRGPGARRRRAEHAAVRTLWWLVMAVFVAFFAVPVLWLLLAPTKTDHALVFSSPLAVGTWSTFAHTWKVMFDYQNGALVSWLENSLIYSFGGLALAVACSVPAGYGLALTQFIGRKTLLGITLVVMLVPSAALVLPLFLEVNAVHLVDTPWSVVLPFGFFPFGVYLTYIFFSSTIPKDLLAAARIDGCSEWRVFWNVAFPLARPIVALVAFFGFVADWNNFFLPFVMLPDSSRYPLQVGLQDLLASTPSFNPTAGGAVVPIYRPELALATIVAVVPVLVVFLFSQRALVSGMLAGATKE